MSKSKFGSQVLTWMVALMLVARKMTVEGFSTMPGCSNRILIQGAAPKHSRRCQPLFYTNDDDDNEQEESEEEEEEVTQQPYGNRSLAWTNRYRKLIPYESARRRAMHMGVHTKEEWDELIQDAKCYRGQYVISRPEEMYQEEWVSWDEFLGVMRPYNETKQLVQNILQLQTMEDYRHYVKSDTQRAEGLRIPARPEIFYKNSGWEGPDAFFGTMA